MIKTTQQFSIRETAKILVPDKFGRSSYLIAIFVVLTMIALIALLSGSLPPKVPLYFTLPWGEARLAPKLMLYLLPLLTLVFGALNLGLGRVSGKISPLLPRALSVASLVASCMMLIALVGIVQSLIL